MPAFVTDTLAGESVKKLTDQIGDVFKGVPHLPKGLVEFFVKVAPWAALLWGIVQAMGSFSLLNQGLGGGSAMQRWAYDIAGFDRTYFLVIGIIGLVSAALLLLAFKHLRERVMTGWMLLFWNMVVSIAGAAFGLLYATSGVIWTVFWILVGLYVLFEMRPYYNGRATDQQSEN